MSPDRDRNTDVSEARPNTFIRGKAGFSVKLISIICLVTSSDKTYLLDIVIMAFKDTVRLSLAGVTI